MSKVNGAWLIVDTPHRYENAHAMGPHSVTCHPAELTFPGADLGFHNSGCPIHLKGAPDVERQRGMGSGIFVFLISKW